MQPTMNCPATQQPHKFTIAVEWERRDREAYGDPVFYAQRIRVTVLRCESCPEEIARG